MGQGNKYFKVGGLRFLQALTPREHCCRFLIACPSGPLSRHRERGWGGKLGPPAGRKTRWGEEGAPQRGGLPVV